MQTDTAAVALGWYGALFVTGFLARVLLHRRRTGSFGVPGVSGPPGSIAWWTGALAPTALILCLAAPVTQLADLAAPITALDTTPLHLVGIPLAVAGLTLVVLAQQAMGTSWRAGVDPDQHTDLITHGPFRYVRNPIYTAILTGVTGVTLLAPNPIAVTGLLVLITAFQLQVRGIEEPHLRRAHGARYRHYTRRTGRFLPRIGRDRSGPSARPSPGSQ
jgi:protein-S-isoprenylcysteine O-methyltransferase Ste14